MWWHCAWRRKFFNQWESRKHPWQKCIQNENLRLVFASLKLERLYLSSLYQARPDISSVLRVKRKRSREEALYYPSVVCQDYQILPQNYTPALAAHFWRRSSHFFLLPWGWIYCGKKYGEGRGMALPLLSQLTCN